MFFAKKEYLVWLPKTPLEMSHGPNQFQMLECCLELWLLAWPKLPLNQCGGLTDRAVPPMVGSQA